MFKYSNIFLDIFVFPIPGGPSRIKIDSDAKATKIASAISEVDFVQVISSKILELGLPLISNDIPLYKEIIITIPFSSIDLNGISICFILPFNKLYNSFGR